MKSIRELEEMKAELEEAIDRENNIEILQYLEDELDTIEVHIDEAKSMTLFLDSVRRY